MMNLSMRCTRTVLAVCGALLLSACATAKPVAFFPGLESPGRDAALYGQFLAGQAAAASGQNDTAARYFSQALALDPENASLAERAFIAALLAGDIPQATQLAKKLPSGEAPLRGLAVLTQVVEALASGSGQEGGRAALRLLSSAEVTGPYRNSTLLLTPLAAGAAGDWDTALALPSDEGNPALTVYAQSNQALLLERAGRKAEAESVYQALIGGGQAAPFLTLAYGAFLERQGQAKAARALYSVMLQGDPQNPTAKEGLNRLDRKLAAPPLASIRQTAASVMLSAAVATVNQRQIQGGLILVQLALTLDPKRDETIVMAGELMAMNKDPSGAQAMLARISPRSPQFVQARARMIWGMNQAGDKDGAIALARDTVSKTPGNLDAMVTLADILRINSRFEESISVVDQVIAKKPEPYWGDYFSRGMSRERSGRWEEGEQDLMKALDLNPNEPDIQNYLGYSWIERGVNLSQGIDLVRRAVEARPDSGAITDSLGWGYYRLGDYKRAVELLERAAQLDASDPELNDHLGDAYWRTGRKIEAEFQWKRVLTLSPSDKLKAAVETKLESGLPPAEPAPPVTLTPPTPTKPPVLPKGGIST